MGGHHLGNVAQLYARLANSIRNGTTPSPGFDAAVKRHRLIDAIVRASMQRQELSLHGAQGKGTKLAELPIPAKYRYVPENTPANSPYNVAQLYARLANSIRNGTPASPGFDAAVKRHRLIDAIVRASTTGQKQRLD